MDRGQLREIIAHLHTLPTLPSICERIVKTMENPQSSARDLSAIVCLDPVVTARLLQAVDWRRSIFADRVPTIGKAITVLGFEALRKLVATQQMLDVEEIETSHTAPFALRQLWLHSVGTAVAARTVAAAVGYPEPEECYVAGLLHDIGKLVEHSLFPDRFFATIAEAERARNTFYFCEVESGKASHAVHGRILAEQWDLPPKVIEAVGLHHTPNLAESHLKVVAITHVADILARALGLGSGCDRFVPPPKPAGVSAVGLRSSQIEAVMTEIEREIPRVAAPLLH